jgi:hypothetical protein
MAFVAASGTEIPANHSQIAAPLDAPHWADTAPYGGVWPNEWPNGKVDARDNEAADRTREGRDRDDLYRGVGAPSRHQATRTATMTGGALSVSSKGQIPLIPGGA